MSEEFQAFRTKFPEPKEDKAASGKWDQLSK
jgi:hypothetical protein